MLLTHRFGAQSLVMARKNARPATATGTPAICDQALVVVTLRQLIAPLSEQARVAETVLESQVCRDQRSGDAERKGYPARRMQTHTRCAGWYGTGTPRAGW